MPPATLVRRSLSEQAYAALLDEIVRGRLAPGERLRDAELAERFGVSRTPVREALRRLVDEGLVEVAPSAATRVAPVDVDGAADAFPVVAALHGLATRLGVPALTARDDRRMAEADAARTRALERGDVLRAIAADDRFHGVLVERSANAELDRTLRRLMPKVRRLDLLHFRELADHRRTTAHAAILDACARRDAAEAARLVEESFLELGAQAAELLARRAAKDAAAPPDTGR